MMKPVWFFPFTSINFRQIECLTTFFETVHYFTADHQLEKEEHLTAAVTSEMIIPHFVSESTGSRVQRKMEQFLNWASIHKGNEHNLKALMKDTPYFRDDTQVSAISSALRGKEADAKSPDDAKKEFERHLLFLKMAQLNDRQKETIDSDLKEVEQAGKKLFNTLQGEDVPDLNPFQSGDLYFDPGETMTRERILSWGACMTSLNKGQWAEPPLFVTTSPAVFAHLESICSKDVNALDIDQIKVHEDGCEQKKDWQNRLGGLLINAVQGKGKLEKELLKIKDSCKGSGQIKLSLFSGNEINTLFNSSQNQTAVCLVKLK